MDERIAAAFALLPDYLARHVILCASALALGVLIGIPLAILAARRPRLRAPALATASLVQTIPGLALLALFYPLLLGLSAVTKPLLGFGLPALGFLPSLLALTLYSVLPILRNGVAGFTGLDPAVIEAADAVGMTSRQRLTMVEAPLAAPVVMAGIRTAAVWTIGAATLSTSVGQTSLGNYIFSGLQTENWIFVLFGCAAAAVLALVADQILGLIETGATRRDARRIMLGLAGVILGTVAAAVPLIAAAPGTYAVGAKNFSEQFILAELISERLARAGATTRRKDGLGSAVIFRALAGGDIDVYVDYSGTLWTNVMERRDAPPRDEMLRALAAWMAERHGVKVLGALGFENAYVLAMRKERAAALGVRSIADLTAPAPKLTLGSDLEFLSRPEWATLRDAYGLRFAVERSYSPTFMYRALEDGSADVISAFSSDGRIAAQDLLVLDDPRHAIPSYDAMILISPQRADDQVLIRALSPLIGRISVERMRQANFMVDRETGKAAPKDAARFLAGAIGLQP
ncbi:MAG: osmoprotectant transport system substrate-binding protein opuBD [Alphaproteobacteria bacterium]|jgi:osmoprotectant transport system permease protein|nr:osmoprotectant transport system substrate-binding protein opuBD [Alphaproteobacteria bacterium]